MADTKWETLNLTATFPEELKQASAAVSEATAAISSALAVVKQALEIAEQFVSLLEGNPVEQAIKLILDEIEKLVEETLNNSIKAHLIAIPFQKRFLGVSSGLRYRTVTQDYIPRFRNLLDAGAFAERTPDSVPVEVVNFIDNSTNAVGGTAGFWKTFMLSLIDEGDLNRPLFGVNDAVAGVCILGGGSDITELLPSISLLEQLFQTGSRIDMAAGTRPRAPTIRARALGGVRPTSTSASVLLTWDSVTPLLNAPLYSTSRYVVTDIFVIRSTDVSLRSKYKWSDVFTREPQDSRSDLQEEGDTKVIARIANDGFVTGHTDLAINIETTKVYYYAICLRYTINGAVQPMGNFSNCVRIDLRTSAQSMRSVPPDWISTPNIFELIPVVDELLTTVLGALSFLRTRSFSDSGIAATIKQLIDQINNIIAEIEIIVERINRINSLIASILNASAKAVLSVTVITVTKGGIKAWSAELAKRLSDESDSSRPLLGTTDLCTGIVLVGGAPNYENIAAFGELLKKLFGEYQDKLLDAINSIELEPGSSGTAPSFGDDMRPGSRTTPTPATALDAGLRPTDKPVC